MSYRLNNLCHPIKISIGFLDDIMEATKEDDEWYRNMPKADLSKRPIQPKKLDMDMTGTFKKLDID